MPSVDDIIAQRDTAIAILTRQIVAANDLKNGGAAGMDEKIDALEEQKAAAAAQAYEAALDDAALTRALTTLKAVTKDMNDVAKKMVSATSFIANFNSFIAASSKVIPALKGSA